MTFGAYYALQLRSEIVARNHALAIGRNLPHVVSRGGMQVVVYQPRRDGLRHGNFLDLSYAAIVSHPEWRRRLDKVHAQAGTCLPRSIRGWKELDSCTSSDALLMKIFCYPGVADSPLVAALLGVGSPQTPEFGHKPRVPLQTGLADRTEVDLRFGDLLIEAKLTETDFQEAEAGVLRGYRDFKEVFDERSLPKSEGKLLSYQLIRNTLAAHASGCSFCVLLDGRRLDLLEMWYAIMRCVRIADLRLRCKVLTWQELSEALPSQLRDFLDTKYGIVPAGCAASTYQVYGEEI